MSYSTYRMILCIIEVLLTLIATVLFLKNKRKNFENMQLLISQVTVSGLALGIIFASILSTFIKCLK